MNTLDISYRIADDNTLFTMVKIQNCSQSIVFYDVSKICFFLLYDMAIIYQWDSHKTLRTVGPGSGWSVFLWKLLFFVKIYSTWWIYTFSKKLKEYVDGLFQDPATLSKLKKKLLGVSPDSKLCTTFLNIAKMIK